MYRRKIERDRTTGWRDSFHICSLSEEDRHLGHIVRKGRCWNAFDCTHLNDARDGFRHLGTFLSVLGAKHAVELAAGFQPAPAKALAVAANANRAGSGVGLRMQRPYDPALNAACETTRAMP